MDLSDVCLVQGEKIMIFSPLGKKKPKTKPKNKKQKPPEEKISNKAHVFQSEVRQRTGIAQGRIQQL